MPSGICTSVLPVHALVFADLSKLQMRLPFSILCRFGRDSGIQVLMIPLEVLFPIFIRTIVNVTCTPASDSKPS